MQNVRGEISPSFEKSNFGMNVFSHPLFHADEFLPLLHHLPQLDLWPFCVHGFSG